MSSKYLKDVVIATGMNLDGGGETERICGLARVDNDGIHRISLTVSGPAHDENPDVLRELAQMAAVQSGKTIKIKRYTLTETLETIHPKTGE